MSVEYVVYGAGFCEYCKEAKGLLEELHTPFEYRNIDLNEYRLQLIEDLGDEPKTVPQIFTTCGQYIGGYNDLIKTLDLT